MTQKTRSLTPRGKATKKRIVAAAAQIVHAKGAERMSLDEVMEMTGASRSQLYHYFDSKDGLVREVIDFRTDQILETARAHLGALASREALQAWRDMMVAANRAGVALGCPLGSLANELSVHSESARSRLELSFAAWSAAIGEGLRHMQRSGQLARDLDTDGLAMAVLAALQGGILLSKTARDTRPLELALDMALAHIDRHLVEVAKAPRS